MYLFWQNRSRRKVMLWGMYLINVLFTFHLALPLYINSLYLETFTTETIISAAFSVGAALTIIAIITASRSLERFGNYATTLTLLGLEVLALLGLALSGSLVIALIALMAHLVLVTTIKFNLDVFVEYLSEHDTVGEIRGMFLTFADLAYVCAPFLAGLMIDVGEFSHVYLVAALFLIPVMLLVGREFRGFAENAYEHTTLPSIYKAISFDSNIRNIFFSNLWLKIFFAWMVVYTPIYLHQHIGFDFATIGIIFSVMLSSYVLLDYPLGWLADKKYGEKEMLIIGFVVIAFFVSLIGVTTSTSVILWALLLFGTRAGCAMVQIMSESYFFKHVESSNTRALTAFRMTHPLGYLIAPLLAATFLVFLPFQMLFIAIGAFMMLGILPSLRIVDTK